MSDQLIIKGKQEFERMRYALERMLLQGYLNNNTIAQQSKDFIDCILAIEVLSFNKSHVSINPILKQICKLCQQQLPYQTNPSCICKHFYHDKCFYNENLVQYEQLKPSVFSSVFSYQDDPKNNENLIMKCNGCSNNKIKKMEQIISDQLQRCMYKQCGRGIGAYYIEYSCSCKNHTILHPDCFFDLYKKYRCDLTLIKCDTCLQDIHFNQLQQYRFDSIMYKQCSGCQTYSKLGDFLVFSTGQYCCLNCAENSLRGVVEFYITNNCEGGQSFRKYVHSLQEVWDDYVFDQFFKTDQGIILQKEIDNKLSERFFEKEDIHECPGFILVEKEGNNKQLDNEMAQKYITMKRQSEDDEEIMNEYTEKLNRLKERYHIKPCGERFQINFDNDEQRIFQCHKCRYRDCRDQTCKSPHFNLTCEMFKKLKEFKIQNQENNNNANNMAIYKIEYEEKIIIVNQEYINILRQNPNNQIKIIEEIQNNFFKACNLPLNLFDPTYDKDWTPHNTYTARGLQYRGKIKGNNVQYHYPIHNNLKGYGINIVKLYGPQQNLAWLSKNTDENTYIVGFHGTKSLVAVSGIIANGFQAGGGQAYRAHQCPYTNTIVGAGVYFGASIEVALGYTSPITLPNTGERYRIIFQCRLNSKTVKGACAHGTKNEYYVVNNPQDIRIYRILLIKEN